MAAWISIERRVALLSLLHSVLTSTVSAITTVLVPDDGFVNVESGYIAGVGGNGDTTLVYFEDFARPTVITSGGAVFTATPTRSFTRTAVMQDTRFVELGNVLGSCIYVPGVTDKAPCWHLTPGPATTGTEFHGSLALHTLIVSETRIPSPSPSQTLSTNSSQLDPTGPQSTAPTPTPSSKNHTSTIVGAVVGTILGIIVIVLVILYLFRKRRLRRREISGSPYSTTPSNREISTRATTHPSSLLVTPFTIPTSPLPASPDHSNSDKGTRLYGGRGMGNPGDGNTIVAERDTDSVVPSSSPPPSTSTPPRSTSTSRDDARLLDEVRRVVREEMESRGISNRRSDVPPPYDGPPST